MRKKLRQTYQTWTGAPLRPNAHGSYQNVLKKRPKHEWKMAVILHHTLQN